MTALSLPAQKEGANISPPPRWKENDGSKCHPQTLDEWNWHNDEAPHSFERSLRRLNVAGDYEDGRAPDQMALVLRIDLLRLIGEWTHKNAYFQMMKEKREAALATPDTAPDGVRQRTIEECAEVAVKTTFGPHRSQEYHRGWAEGRHQAFMDIRALAATTADKAGGVS